MPARAASILTTVVLVLTLGAANAQVEPKAPPTQERTLGYYRCGPQGQELRDSPCPDEQGRAAFVHKDSVDPKDAEAARQRAAAESRDLAARQRERDRETAKAPKAAAGIDGRVQPKSTTASTIASTTPKKPSDPKRPKPKDPKKPPKKKPKVPTAPKAPNAPKTPNTPDGALQPRAAAGAEAAVLAAR